MGAYVVLVGTHGYYFFQGRLLDFLIAGCRSGLNHSHLVLLGHLDIISAEDAPVASFGVLR